MPEITSKLSTALADRYRIEREIGEGGMATVYLAYTSPIWYTSGRSNGWPSRNGGL